MTDDKKKRSGLGLYERKWERFAVSRQGLLLSVGLDLALPKVRSCKLIDISLGSATFTVNTTIGLASHYYLTIVGVGARIGCAEVHRGGDRIAVQFIKEIDEDLLHAIVRADYLTGSARQTQPGRPPVPGLGRSSTRAAFT